MPYLEVTMPRAGEAVRSALAKNLTQAFVEATGFPGEIFHVRFCQYEPGEMSVGAGELWTGQGTPHLHMMFHGPQLGVEIKRKAAELLTKAFVRAADRTTGSDDPAPGPVAVSPPES